jgi:hypothetical protein
MKKALGMTEKKELTEALPTCWIDSAVIRGRNERLEVAQIARRLDGDVRHAGLDCYLGIVALLAGLGHSRDDVEHLVAQRDPLLEVPVRCLQLSAQILRKRPRGDLDSRILTVQS